MSYSPYKYFIINSLWCYKTQKIVDATTEFLNPGDIIIKRIRKPLAFCTRLSIKKHINNQDIKKALKLVSERLKISFKEQGLQPNEELQNIGLVLEKQRNLDIDTLNANGIYKKAKELQLMLDRYKPDIFLLQESWRKDFEKKTIIEKLQPAWGTSNWKRSRTRNRHKIRIRINI